VQYSVSDLIKRRCAIARKATARACETQVQLRAQAEQRVIDGERRSTEAARACCLQAGVRRGATGTLLRRFAACNHELRFWAGIDAQQN
jgi:hypothetical protein